MNNYYHEAERSLLLNQPLDSKVADQLLPNIRSLYEDMLSGQYAALVKKSLLFNTNTKYSLDISLEEWVQQCIETLLSPSTIKQEEEELERLHSLFLTAIACLNIFIQQNWTGPLVDLTISELVGLDDHSKLHAQCLNSLSADGEQVYHLSDQLGYLVVAKTILLSLKNQDVLLTNVLWARRAVFIQQQLLDECTGTLQDLLTDLTNMIGKNKLLLDDKQLRVRYELETALVYSYFGQDKDAFDQMKQAQVTSGFQWSLTGALGKRTKFQTFDVSQLVVLAESEQQQQQQQEKEEDTMAKPETLDLNDDTLLDKISFTKTEDNDRDATKRHGNLLVIDQALLLAFCLNVKNTNPDHGMTYEEMVPYVTRVLENCNNWMVHTMSLLLRSRLEAHKSRTVERSALQLQALVDQIKLDSTEEDVANAQDRLAYFYDLLLPSKWEMERELARRFVSLGVIRSALEIFERLEMWEDVVSCYQMLEQPQKAKEVLERLLEADPNSPKLWCIMGDVLMDPELWHKAWHLSGGKFARAMRSLGSYHYKKNEYEKAIEYYQQALAINPLFEGSWYVMGCAAMMVEQWDIGIKAFQRVVNLDNEQAEAWNNLSSIYVRTDRKLDAFLALKQACKLKFDNWQMWQNLLVVSVDIGQFADAIWAMQRVVDLRWDKVREEAVDIQVLHMIVASVVQNWPDVHNQEGRRLARHVQRLLENVILSRITNSPDIWRIAARFYVWQENWKDALDATIKAYRAVMHDPRLESDVKIFEDVARWALELVDMYENVGNRGECDDWNYQSRLILKGLMGKVRDIFDDTPTYDLLKDRLDELKQT
ncbi:uncharacterized protein BX664DRAFT_334618 [Halteromyces radiatus]|uniref:uncharacterized protein n=1 Tax=Halteromyces radiatus TaxID=101107 RepID=UPI00221F9106|nr:uncharacterized protein BX664DRAFT_334618 [Halteromyces radiatus]KAI8085980.1 hypothetical protein BX664DRAFT_334618 [Halteromyces radiatus]